MHKDCDATMTHLAQPSVEALLLESDGAVTPVQLLPPKGHEMKCIQTLAAVEPRQSACVPVELQESSPLLVRPGEHAAVDRCAH